MIRGEPWMRLFGNFAFAARALLALALFCCLGSAHAVYINRYSTIANGALTFTGNTVGLNKAAGANAPGTSMAIGTFIAANGTSVDGTYPVGTTATYTANGSSAVLSIPPGSTVLYAELIWSGSYSYGGESRVAVLGNPVTLVTPVATASVPPSNATSQTLGTPGATVGTCATAPCYYVRSADVTNLVRAAGTGSPSFSVLGIPATQGDSENNANNGGWTLAVAYANNTLPARNLTIFVGAEVGGAAQASVTGFCTPPTGPRSGRMMVSAVEGDSGLTGDQMLFGPTAATMTARSGPRNNTTNFFASQITDDAGNLNTSGSFGTSNQTPGTASTGRQGYDVANVDISTTLSNNQTSAFARGTTTNDQYMINALGLQINVGSPIFPVTVKQVSKTTTYVGDTITYTINLDNTAGTANADNVVFTDAPPPGTTYIASSLTVDGVATAGNPSTGVNVGTVAAGAMKVVRFSVRVDSIPAAPAAALYVNSASWAYEYISCAGQPTTFGSVSTNNVTTTIARLSISKSVTPTGTVQPGTTLTYSIAMANDGTAASSGTTLQDAVPAGTSYVSASTRFNGNSIADVAGNMPYSSAATVNSTGQATGVLAVGQTATVVFNVRVIDSASGVITNTAVGDIDGGGAAATSSATALTPIQLAALLSISKDNGVSSTLAGTSVTYVVTASNAGPSAAHGTIVTDPAATGLVCTTLSCSASAGASCPASVDLNTFQTSGLAIPSFPANSSVSFSLGCAVTATGI
jgi:large repetitive protein